MLAPAAVDTTKLCPHCGHVLRPDCALDEARPGRLILRTIFFWAALALILAFLWSARGTAERVGALGAIALLFHLSWRSWHRRAQGAPPVRQGYHCDNCRRQFGSEV